MYQNKLCTYKILQLVANNSCLALLFLLESPLDIRCPKWLADEGGPDEAAFCGMAMRASMRSAGATAVAASSFWGG